MSMSTFARTIVICVALVPVLAVAETSSAPSSNGDNDVKLQRRIKELESENRRLSDRVAELQLKNSQLQLQLDTRRPQFRVVIPPSAAPFFSPQTTPVTPPPAHDQREWKDSGQGNTWHYLVPAESAR